jgi:hypothetical protein
LESYRILRRSIIPKSARNPRQFGVLNVDAVHARMRVCCETHNKALRSAALSPRTIDEQQHALSETHSGRGVDREMPPLKRFETGVADVPGDS